MPDDIPVTPSSDLSAPSVATDEISGRHYQKIKSGWGVDGVWVETADAPGQRFPVDAPDLEALVTTLNGRMVAATSHPLATGSGDVALVAAAANLRLMGFSFLNTSSVAVASLIIRHGTGTGDPTLAVITLGPNESVRDWFGPGGIAAPDGIFIDRLTGDTGGSVQTMVAA